MVFEFWVGWFRKGIGGNVLFYFLNVVNKYLLGKYFVYIVELDNDDVGRNKVK